MRILVTGRGAVPSWEIRGEQIAAGLGATVKPMATLADMRAADVILVVKRVPNKLLVDLRRCGRPWAYDVVDAYPQRAAGAWSKGQCIEWLHEHLTRLRPDVVIWPNLRMREDAGMPGPVIYHHHRPGIEVNPIRERIEVIGYEGSPRYLDGWGEAIEAECRRRGVRFVVNPERLADVDVILALRGGLWDGYASRHWKSNVKLANAHAAGCPFIGAPEAGYLETATGAERWASDADELALALDSLEPWSIRLETSERFRHAAIPLQQTVEQFRSILYGLKS